MLDRIPRPVFVLALLAILALGIALGTNALVARKLSVSPERLAAARSGAPAPRTATADSGDGGDALASAGTSKDAKPSSRSVLRKVDYWMDPIIKRNLFDSANSLIKKPDAPAEPNGDGEVDKASDIAATLIATSVASDAIWSTALVSTENEGVHVYRIDEKLLDATIKEIHRPSSERPAHIILLRNGSLEYLEAGGKKKKKSTAKKVGDDKPKKKTNSRGKRDWGIEKTGDNEYSVPEDDVKWALDNLDKMSREARVVPNFSDGKTNGFKVFAIRRNSALRKMGLKNNDVLTSVNGFDLSNTEKALEIYGKLQSEKSFSLEVLRNGEPVTIEYGIK
ncbi:MAG: PDZ domain-containing protein [Deltaproteobacteria bacterium]|nr:PDZ domain-containing protein [Deltaproteobacteria bacterium]